MACSLSISRLKLPMEAMWDHNFSFLRLCYHLLALSITTHEGRKPHKLTVFRSSGSRNVCVLKAELIHVLSEGSNFLNNGKVFMKPLFLRDARRKEGSRTGSAVLSYSLWRSRALVALCVHLPGGKKLFLVGKF